MRETPKIAVPEWEAGLRRWRGGKTLGGVMSKRTDALVVAALAASGGVLGEVAVGGGVAGTVAGGLTPVGVQAANELVGLARRRRGERVGWVLEAAGLLDAGTDIFDERQPDYDERVELLGRVMEAAGRSTFQAKLRALAQVLADGLHDDAEAGEALVLAAALAVLEPPHVVLVDLLDRHPDAPEAQRLQGGKHHFGWQLDQLVVALPNLASVMSGLLAVLVSQGLLREDRGSVLGSGIGPTSWKVTDLGRRCLFLLDGVR